MLRIKDLRKSYKNSNGESFEIINVPEFELNNGEQLALTGESGSGKSTFLNIISGIVRSDSGQVMFDGIDITGLSESKSDSFRSKNIGYIFQTFNLLQGFTAIENVMLGMMFAGKADKKKSEESLDRVGLSGKIYNKPSELSVGEQQRVSVARAMVNSPKLILADEPTANLDRRNSELVIELIKEICTERNSALLLVSHEDEVIRHMSNFRQFTGINVSNVTAEGV
jgi:putative ABC transport system ATP-binding protein